MIVGQDKVIVADERAYDTLPIDFTQVYNLVKVILLIGTGAWCYMRVNFRIEAVA